MQSVAASPGLLHSLSEKLSEARGSYMYNGIGFSAAGEAASPSLLAIQLVLGIRRSARAVQHAGPAGPEARRGGSKVGGRRSSPPFLLVSSVAS